MIVETVMKTFKLVAIAIVIVGVSGCSMVAKSSNEALFNRLLNDNWEEAMFDSGQNNWREHWFLDGEKATIRNTASGMEYYAGPVFNDSSCHAVLWTKQSFSGDLKLEYEYTKLDDETRAVTILYVQATGSGDGPYHKDISRWNELRSIPEMPIYFNNMNTYHISYAAYGLKSTGVDNDYVRMRRYLPSPADQPKKVAAGSDIKPDYFKTGLFEQGAPHKVTVIKKGDNFFMQVRNAENCRL